MVKQCQYPNPHDAKRCQQPVNFRIQLGYYAGAWWVCKDHVDSVLATADGLRASVDELDYKGSYIDGTHRVIPGVSNE